MGKGIWRAVGRRGKNPPAGLGGVHPGGVCSPRWCPAGGALLAARPCGGRWGPGCPRLLHAQDGFYLLWLLVLALLAALPLLKRGYRKWIPPVWVMTALCWGMTGLRVWKAMWSDGSGRYWDYRAEAIGTGRFFAVGWGTGGTLLFALALAAAWLLLSCLTLQRRRRKLRHPRNKSAWTQGARTRALSADASGGIPSARSKVFRCCFESEKQRGGGRMPWAPPLSFFHWGGSGWKPRFIFGGIGTVAAGSDRQRPSPAWRENWHGVCSLYQYPVW